MYDQYLNGHQLCIIEVLLKLKVNLLELLAFVLDAFLNLHFEKTSFKL